MKSKNIKSVVDSLKCGDISLASLGEEDQTEEACLAAVSYDGFEIRHVINQTEKICSAAVSRHGAALLYVIDKTREVCLAAVKNYGMAIYYVPDPDEEICLISVRQDYQNLDYIYNPSDNVYLEAVKQDGWALEYVENQTSDLCKIALESNPLSLIYVDENVYQYNKKEIKKSYSKWLLDDTTRPDKKNIRLLLDKISVILSKLPDDQLVKSVSVDLKNIFTKKNLELSDSLASIKSKADMIAVITPAVITSTSDKNHKIKFL